MVSQMWIPWPVLENDDADFQHYECVDYIVRT